MPTIIVLAAGRDSRFAGAGHPHAQPLAAGMSVLGQTIAQAIASGLSTVVVTTQPLAAEAARWVARRDVVVLPEGGAPAAEALGTGHAIAAGVAARPHAAGWLLLPGDMPRISAASIRAVAAALREHPVVWAQHRGQRGHPVGFSAELYSDLVQLTGDQGARRVVARYPSHGLELPDQGVLVDVHTAADLARVRHGSALPVSDGLG